MEVTHESPLGFSFDMVGLAWQLLNPHSCVKLSSVKVSPSTAAVKFHFGAAHFIKFHYVSTCGLNFSRYLCKAPPCVSLK